MGVGLLAFLGLPFVTQATIGLPVVARSFIVAGLLAPLGLLLGMPFPSGVRMLRERVALVPWMWSINAVATVLGASLATLAVMHLGFQQTILLGVAVYAVGWTTVPRGGFAGS